MRALSRGQIDNAMQLRSRYNKLAEVDVHAWAGTVSFQNLQAHYLELVQRDAQEKKDQEELQEQAQWQAQESLDSSGWLEFGGLGSSYSAVYKLKPGGHCSISAVEIPPNFSLPAPIPPPPPDDDGNPRYTTDPESIAQILRNEWEPTFNKPPPPTPPHDFLNISKDFLKVPIANLIPSFALIVGIISRLHDSAPGPDGIPYSAYKQLPHVTAALVVAAAFSFLHTLFP